MTIDAEAVKKNADLVAVVGHYTPLVKKGREYVGRCIAHSPDEHPSMFVNPEKGLIHCFSCGFSGDVFTFLMTVENVDFQTALNRLNGNSPQWQPAISVPKVPPVPERITSKPPADAPTPKMAIKGLGEPSKIWPYKDAAGELLGYVARYDTPDGKEIRSWTWGRRGKEPPKWGVGAFNKPRPLYGLDRLAQRPTAQVLIVEGEKAADAGIRLLPMCVAITWSGGAQAWTKTDWLPVANRKVLLWPDADQPGYEAMQKLANLLSDPAGLNCAVRVVDADRAGLQLGYDLADFEQDGWDTTRLIEWAKPRTSDYIHKSAAKEPPNLPVAERSEEPPPIGMAEKPGKPPRGKKPDLAIVGGNTNLAEELDTEEVPLAYSEDGVAGQFVALHHDIFRCCHEWGSSSKPMWLAWDGTRWKRERNRVTAMQMAKDLACGLKYQPAAAGLPPKVKFFFETMKFKGCFLDSASFDRRFVAQAETFDSDNFLLNCPAGTIDLRTGILRPHRQEDYITYQTTVSPAPGPTPLWDGVMAFPCNHDPVMEAYLWRAFGYTLTGLTTAEALFFCRGNSGSGKSTMIGAIADILGDYAINIKMDALTETKQQRHPQEIAKLAGKRFIYAQETQQHRRWNEPLICELSGRDVVTAHEMRQNDISFKLKGKIWIHGNHTPHLKGVDGGIARRLHLIEYHERALTIEKQDNTLKDRLVDEYPAILHKMIQGCMDWLQVGLQRPEELTANLQEYISGEDSIGSWFADCCDKSEQAKTPVSDAYTSLINWSQAEGEKYVPSKKNLSQTLNRRGYASGRGVSRYFTGFSLKDAPRQMDAMPLPEPPQDWQDRF